MKPVILLAFANERHGERYLDKLPLEQARLREALEPAVEAELCELVVLPNATVEDILDTFQKSRYRDRIAVFHYAGHADGYQLLLESRTGGNVTAHGSGVVSFLGKQASLKLIFLNGCSTQQQAQEMVEAGVPAVIGTSVSIADDIALTLAVRFYTGLGGGAPLERAWREAQDEIKMRTGGKKGSFRSLYWEGMKEVPDVFPWNLYLRPGSEIVQSWNLPDSVSNPLFGLPEVPRTFALPDEPYIFLRRFERKQAEIFFGRSYYIRELYNRITDPKSAPVISLYGQSGVGKSSLFDAGVNPRLEGTHEVRYVRRDQHKGLHHSVMEALNGMARESAAAAQSSLQPDNHDETRAALDKLRAQVQGLPPALAAELEKTLKRLERKAAGDDRTAPVYAFSDAAGEDLNAVWRHIEFVLQRPLVIILDQVEELFTRPNPDLPHELNDFLTSLRDTFSDPEGIPQGKIILGYRKEYFAEIEEGFRTFEIPRSSLFLEHLHKRDIVEVVNGLTSHPRLTEKYHLTVEAGLGELIATDLLEDKDSPIAPVLQILLTKMWQMAVARNRDQPQFTIAAYERLRAEGILMDDFFEQQLARLREAAPDVVASGLAHDILMRHTTRLGTAETRTLEELRALYSHREDVLEPLLRQLNELYLLTGGGAYTGLAHDTLAPIVQYAYRSGDSPGQRAARIIENKTPGFDPNNTDTALDETDLEIVEKGYAGMRVLNLREQELVMASRKRRDKALAFRRRVKIAGIVALAIILLASGVAVWQSFKATSNLQLAQKNEKDAKNQAARALVQEKLAKGETKRAEKEKARAEQEEQEALAQKKRAEDASHRADSLRSVAEENVRMEAIARKLADEARKAASDSANVAAAQRIEARLQEQEARLQEMAARAAKIEAQKRFYLAKARELAIESQIMEESPENEEIRRKLALIAYRLHTTNGGRAHDADIYDALSKAAPRNTGNKTIVIGQNAGSEVAAVAVLAGGRLVASTHDGRLRTWNMAKPTQAPILLQDSSTNRYNVLVTDGNRQMLIGAGEKDYGIYLIDPSLGKVPPVRMGGHKGLVNEVAFSPDHQYALSCSDDGTVKLWDIASRTERATFRLSGKVTAVTFCRDSRRFVCAYTPGSQYSTLMRGEIMAPQKAMTKLFAYANAIVLTMAASPSRDEVAVGTNRGAVHVYSANNPSDGPEASFAGHLSGSLVTRVAYNASGTQLISAGTDKFAKLWDRNNPRAEAMVVAIQQGFGRDVTFNPEMTQAITAGDGKALYISELFLSELVKPLLALGEAMTLTEDEWDIYLQGVTPYGKVKAE